MQLSYSVDEASKALGIGRTKIYEALNSGMLKARKYNKRTLITKQDMEDFLSRLEAYPAENQ